MDIVIVSVPDSSDYLREKEYSMSLFRWGSRNGNGMNSSGGETSSSSFNTSWGSSKDGGGGGGSKEGGGSATTSHSTSTVNDSCEYDSYLSHISFL